ncbi:hypothetical protein QBC47DRAFT_294217 [Echria macrotheca]|uniref:Clr5 domain-containing protein n=1 Tax=Echria macrotheca TaxID=438768 RepID=A0AAJ0BGV9_9PEZI|nr:hypothetical protein QBC47DRAFT_294217 [Echria macrotheca]
MFSTTPTASFPNVKSRPVWSSIGPSATDDNEHDAKERPIIPTSSADWEAKKDIIGELYMTQNLILNDVMKIMYTQHKFKATARMYKGQFAKWRWSKYNKSGSGTGTANTSRHSKSRNARRRGTPLRAQKPVRTICELELEPVLARPPVLPPLNGDTTEMETTLLAYSSYISTWSEQPTPWKPSSSLATLAKQSSVLQTVRSALDHFSCSRPAEGGAVLRRAFLQIEDAIATGTDVQAIWDCCLAVPQLVLSTGWTDILLIFTRYLHRLTSVKIPPGHPLATIARSVWRMAQRDPSLLAHYVERGWKLWIDRVGRQRGAYDHVTIHLKRGYVILQTPEREILATLIRDFGATVDQSLLAIGPEQTTARILELEQLLARMYLPLFTAESTQRAEAMLHGILDRVVAQHVGRCEGEVDEGWSYLDRYLFFSAYHFLAAIADHNGQRERAADLRRRSLRSPRDVLWLQTAERLEEYLRGEGRLDEAEEIAVERERMAARGVLVRVERE